MSRRNILLDKFEEILTRNPSDYVESGDPEVIFPVYNTDWVRIFIVRHIDDVSSKTIDVEVSIPSSESSEQPLYDIIESSPVETKNTLENLIKHIQYILTLGNSGFTVDFVENGCLLLASLEFDELPDSTIFELLLPPDSHKLV